MRIRALCSVLGMLALGVPASAQDPAPWGIQLRVNDPGSDLSDVLGGKVGFGASLVCHHAFAGGAVPIRARLNYDRWDEGKPVGAPASRFKADSYGISVEICSFFRREATTGAYYALGIAGDHWNVKSVDASTGTSSGTDATKASSTASFGYLLANGFSVELSGKAGTVAKNLEARVWSLSVGYRF